MLRRRACVLLAPTIPRSAWDPAHHNTNWPDSYAAPVADRRHWPAKRWSVGLEPRTPEDWLRFSHRNLAYAYNGALRACGNFPEMLVYYGEMKQRGVKVDVDTLNTLLTRAARYERIHTSDIFLLFDELVGLGARPDVASAETLHTVLEHSAGQPPEWQEARRRQLVELYNHLALEEVERLAPHDAGALMAAQVDRVRRNLRQLRASLSPAVYRRYLALIGSGDRLLRELHNFLWEFVPPGHPSIEVPALDMRVPFVASVLRRPPAGAEADVVSTDYEDADVCSVFLAAAERVVEGNLVDARPLSERRLLLSLLAMLTSTGVLYSADLLAQVMDMIKYSPEDARRDTDAVRVLRYALRGSSARHDEAHRRRWRAVECPADARVIGRYLAARDPWTPTRISPDRALQFPAFPPPSMLAAAAEPAPAPQQQPPPKSAGDAPEEVEGVDMLEMSAQQQTPQQRGEAGALTPAAAAAASSSPQTPRTAEALLARWRDARALVAQTRALEPPTHRRRRPADPSTPPPPPYDARTEVFTGLAVLLRTAATGQRYGSPEAALATQAAPTPPLFAADLPLEVWEALFRCLVELRADMEKFMQDAAAAGSPAAAAPEPELECWEAMLVTLRCVLDYCVLHTQQRAKSGGSGGSEKLFADAAALRQELVEESRTRFGGRLRVLWLQEA